MPWNINPNPYFAEGPSSLFVDNFWAERHPDAEYIKAFMRWAEAMYDSHGLGALPSFPDWQPEPRNPTQVASIFKVIHDISATIHAATGDYYFGGAWFAAQSGHTLNHKPWNHGVDGNDDVKWGKIRKGLWNQHWPIGAAMAEPDPSSGTGVTLSRIREGAYNTASTGITVENPDHTFATTAIEDAYQHYLTGVVQSSLSFEADQDTSFNHSMVWSHWSENYSDVNGVGLAISNPFGPAYSTTDACPSTVIQIPAAWPGNLNTLRKAFGWQDLKYHIRHNGFQADNRIHFTIPGTTASGPTPNRYSYYVQGFNPTCTVTYYQGIIPAGTADPRAWLIANGTAIHSEQTPAIEAFDETVEETHSIPHGDLVRQFGERVIDDDVDLYIDQDHLLDVVVNPGDSFVWAGLVDDLDEVTATLPDSPLYPVDARNKYWSEYRIKYRATFPVQTPVAPAEDWEIFGRLFYLPGPQRYFGDPVLGFN